MTANVADSASDHSATPPARRKGAVSRALRTGRFALLRTLAFVCEPLTRFGVIRPNREIGVLTYHRVAPEVPGAARLTWNVTPDVFRTQLEGLLKLGYEPWPLKRLLSALADGRELPPRTFIVTFDDGHANVHDYAWPILRELKIPATVFLATDYIDKEAPFPFDDYEDKGAPGVPADRWRPMTSAQVRAMMSDPLIEIGSHTHKHIDYRGDVAAFERDMAASIAYLRSQFGVERPSFAFPFGHKNEAMVDAIRRSGVSCALNSETLLVGGRADPFRLGRFGVDDFETSKTITLKLDGWYALLKGRRPTPLAAQ